jgi:hypothetical protein
MLPGDAMATPWVDILLTAASLHTHPANLYIFFICQIPVLGQGLEFATMRSSVRARLAQQSSQSLAKLPVAPSGHGFGNLFEVAVGVCLGSNDNAV